MDEERSSAFEYFMRVATVVGFIVDIGALVMFFSTYQFQVVASGAPQLGSVVPERHIVPVPLAWRDVGLLVIVYFVIVLLAFIAQGFRMFGTGRALFSHEPARAEPFSENPLGTSLERRRVFFGVAGTSLLLLTCGLWASLFLFTSSATLPEMVLFLFSWLLGTLLCLTAINYLELDSDSLNELLRKYLVTAVLVLPAMLLLGGWILGMGAVAIMGRLAEVMLLSCVYAFSLYLACAFMWRIAMGLATWYDAGRVH